MILAALNLLPHMCLTPANKRTPIIKWMLAIIFAIDWNNKISSGFYLFELILWHINVSPNSGANSLFCLVFKLLFIRNCYWNCLVSIEKQIWMILSKNYFGENRVDCKKYCFFAQIFVKFAWLILALIRRTLIMLINVRWFLLHCFAII